MITNLLAECRRGRMVFNQFDEYVGKSLRFYGEFSEGEAQLFEKLIKPGDLVIEVGANIGAHTVALSQFVGDGVVFAFEPLRPNFNLLCANLALNSCSNVVADRIAITAKTGQHLALPLVNVKAPGNFGGITLLADYSNQPHEIIMGIALDSLALALPAVAFIKADVEGMEYHVLAGAQQTIQKHRPILYVENDREEQAPALVSILMHLRYRMFHHIVPLFNADNFRGVKEDYFTPVGCCSLNLLCFPKEKQFENFGLEELIL